MRSSGLLRKATVLAGGLVGMAGLVGTALPAAAQVTYNRNPSAAANAVDPLSPLFPFSDPSPYDQAFDVVPSYQVQTDPYAGGPPVRVVAHCQFPNGWNVTDFDRSINGIPAGIDHQCPVGVAPAGRRVRARY